MHNRGQQKKCARKRTLLRTTDSHRQIDVGSHTNVQDLLDTLISLENALGGKEQTPIYPTCLPYSAQNIARLLPQIFTREVCKKANVYLAFRFEEPSFPVGQAIHFSTAQYGPPTRTTIVRFSKASFTPGSIEVTVDMGVFTAKVWTDVASVVIRRGRTTYAKLYPRHHDENPAMNHLRAEFNDAGGGTFGGGFARSMEDVLDKTKKLYAQELPWLQNTKTMYGGVMPSTPFVDTTHHAPYVWHEGMKQGNAFINRDGELEIPLVQKMSAS